MSRDGGDYPVAAGLFRREAGRLLALLTRILGTENLEIAEDAVQETFLLALETWETAGPPDNPPAWLFRVAKNKAVDAIRRRRHSVRADFGEGGRLLLASEYTLISTLEARWAESPIEDDMLGMMFACCHPGLQADSQIALILKTLCGFSTAEIAGAFLVAEDTVSKRLYRAKEFFRRERIKPAIPSGVELKERLGAVLHSVYLVFNEGYHSSRQGDTIRSDLIGEALALGRLLAGNPKAADPRASALLALMCFQAARCPGRVGSDGGLVLLPDQDRGLWDAGLIAEGCRHLDRSASGESMTAYHLEAAIAWEHCRAPSFAATDWALILGYYRWLCRIAPGPMADLNRIAAQLQAEGPEAAAWELDSLPDREGLARLPLYHGLRGEIQMRLGKAVSAREGFLAAAGLTPNLAERKVLLEKARKAGEA